MIASLLLFCLPYTLSAKIYSHRFQNDQCFVGPCHSRIQSSRSTNRFNSLRPQTSKPILFEFRNSGKNFKVAMVDDRHRWEDVIPRSGHDIYEAPWNIGGSGTFKNSTDLLSTMLKEAEMELESELTPYLQSTIDILSPQEQDLEELKRKFEETENTIFGSQISPFEIRISPLQKLKKFQELVVAVQKEYIEELQELQNEAEDLNSLFLSEGGETEIFYSGFNRTWSVNMNRNFAWGSNAETDLVLLASQDKGFEACATWKIKSTEQPILIDNRLAPDGSIQGMVLGFAVPEEGPRRLCAVSEWFGDARSDDVLERFGKLLGWLQTDKLQAVSGDRFLLTTWDDAIPLRRRNELWVELFPPNSNKAWYQVADKIATDEPAVNSSLYQLKDCPWATPTPWGLYVPWPGAGQGRGSDGGLEWRVGGGWLGQQSLRVSGLQPGAALDKSSGGQLALWRVDPAAAGWPSRWTDRLGGGQMLGRLEEVAWKRDDCDPRRGLAVWGSMEAEAPQAEGRADAEEEGAAEPEALGLFALGPAGSGPPWTAATVEAARAALLQSIQGAGRHQPCDPLSFRLRVSGPGLAAQLWTRVRRAESGAT